MASDRKQLNVRLDPDTEALIPGLLVSVKAAIGLPISQSDLFRLGLLELAKKYPPARVPEEQPAPAPAPKPSKAPARKRSG